MDVVWMDLKNSTAVCGRASSDLGDSPGQARLNIKTLKFSTDIEFYYSYPGHYEAGMHGILRIGGGGATDDNLNSNGFLLFFISLITFISVKI